MSDKTVLLAEDDPAHQALFKRAVRGSRVPCRLKVVSDGVEAIEYLFATGEYKDRNADKLPDLILLDLRMPRMDGLQVLQVLCRTRGEKNQRFPPVVVLTSSENDQDVLRAYQYGAQSYICKPLDFPEFSRAVCETVEYWLGLNRPVPRLRTVRTE
jgi:two-component system, response regulator